MAVARIHPHDVPKLLRARSGACASPSPADPSADPWMADNPTDVTDNGTVPSAGLTGSVPTSGTDARSDDGCLRGAARCVRRSRHERRGGARLRHVRRSRESGHRGDELPLRDPAKHATELAPCRLRRGWGLLRPRFNRAALSDQFHHGSGMRQFTTLFLDQGITTSIGPIPWTPPPLPPADDHYCLYMRVLSVQATPPVETGKSTPTSPTTTISPGATSRSSRLAIKSPGFFTVRNISDRSERLALRFEIPYDLRRSSTAIRVTLSPTLARALRDGKGGFEGLKPDGEATYLITGGRATITGLQMAPREQGQVEVRFGPIRRSVRGDVTITQLSGNPAWMAELRCASLASRRKLISDRLRSPLSR